MVDMTDMFVNLSQSYPQINKLIWYTAYIIGIALLIKGLYSLKVYGDMRNMMQAQHSLKGPLSLIVVGAILLYLPQAAKIFIKTGFGSKTVNILSYSQDQGWDTNVSKAIFGFVQIVGLISFIRGWLFLVQASQQHAQQGITGKAWTHIIGGILAINILGVKDVLWATFGLS